MDHDVLYELERKLLSPAVRKNRGELEALLSDTFIEFGTSGNIWDRKSIIESLLKEPASQILTANFKSIELADGVVLVTYRTDREDTDGSKSSSLRSSLWKRVQGQWKMIFHQGTKTEPGKL